MRAPLLGVTSNPLIDELFQDMPIVEWLIPDILVQDQLVILAGVPGVGKSVLSYTLAFALATGTKVLGKEIEQAQRVLYFDNENSWSDRVQYQRNVYYGLGEPDAAALAENLWVYPFVLGLPNWPDELHKRVQEKEPALVVIDTAASSFAIKNENDNGEAAQTIQALRQIQGAARSPLTILLIKHASINRENGGYQLRGAKFWDNAADCLMYYKRSDGKPLNGIHTAKLEAAKSRAFGFKGQIKVRPTKTPNDGLLLDKWASRD